MNLLDLHAPYPAAEIEWRVGSTNGDKTSGLALAYLTARHVMERLDTVCGPENWQDRYEFHGARTVCYLSIRVGDEWVTKADGAGDSDVEAEKGAISDALKRAAVKWGIGRYLYDLGNIWVDLEPAGRSVRIKKSEYAKLQKALNAQFGPALTTAANDAAPASQASAGPSPYNLHVEALTNAKDLDGLQILFKLAWRDAGLSDGERENIKALYDRRKAALSKPPTVPPNFDDMEKEIPFPPSIQEAARNMSAG